VNQKKKGKLWYLGILSIFTMYWNRFREAIIGYYFGWDYEYPWKFEPLA
jgi:hypothetical protein